MLQAPGSVGVQRFSSVMAIVGRHELARWIGAWEGRGHLKGQWRAPNSAHHMAVIVIYLSAIIQPTFDPER